VNFGVAFGYGARLLCLSLASFVLVLAALGLVVSVSAPVWISLAGRMRARAGARLLLSVRLAPLAGALAFVASLCVPSYLWLEPERGEERAGVVSLVVALIGLGLQAWSLARSARALRRSARFVRECEETGVAAEIPGWQSPVLIVEGHGPVLALAGVLRPRLILTRRLRDALSHEQLAVALRHEEAHRRSHDNLKRFLLVLAPDVFPFLGGLRAMEAMWGRLAEWAADDEAAEGRPGESVRLAETLLRCARLGSAGSVPELSASLLCCDDDLAARVERLLGGRETSRSGIGGLLAGVLMAGGVAALLLQPVVLRSVHLALELLME